MDLERQPLLQRADRDVRCRRYRRLTYEEVLQARDRLSWRRARCCLVFFFWAIMAMFLSIIVYILITSPKCSPSDAVIESSPAVAPVHMTFAPLISNGRLLNDRNVYSI